MCSPLPFNVIKRNKICPPRLTVRRSVIFESSLISTRPPSYNFLTDNLNKCLNLSSSLDFPFFHLFLCDRYMYVLENL